MPLPGLRWHPRPGRGQGRHRGGQPGGVGGTDQGSSAIPGGTRRHPGRGRSGARGPPGTGNRPKWPNFHDREHRRGQPGRGRQAPSSSSRRRRQLCGVAVVGRSYRKNPNKSRVWHTVGSQCPQGVPASRVPASRRRDSSSTQAAGSSRAGERKARVWAETARFRHQDRRPELAPAQPGVVETTRPRTATRSRRLWIRGAGGNEGRRFQWPPGGRRGIKEP